jgi:hypothetical protein
LQWAVVARSSGEVLVVGAGSPASRDERMLQQANRDASPHVRPSVSRNAEART